MTGVGSRHRPRRDRKPAAVSDIRPRVSLELQSLLPYPEQLPGREPVSARKGYEDDMLSFCGIDVSKDRLDVMVLPDQQCSSVSNDPAGWAELVEQLRGCSISAIGLEASGGYERGVMRALLAAGMPVRQINPFRLRQFANASGVLAKNDPLDARMIASFVAIMPTRPAQRQAPAIERIAEILAVRRQLSDEKSPPKMPPDCWKTRCCNVFPAAASPGSPPISISSTAPDRDRRGRSSSPIATAAQLDAGCRTGAGLYADRAVARARSPQPQTDRSSGRRCTLCLRQRQAQGRALHLGRPRPVRHILYMAAMSASQHNPALKAFHRPSQVCRQAAKSRDRGGDAQDDRYAQRHGSP